MSTLIAVSLAEQVERRAALVARLDKGEAHIRALNLRGEDTEALTDFWLDLLAEYRAVEDERRRRPTTQGRLQGVR